MKSEYNKKYFLLGIPFTFVLSVIFHFLYEYTDFFLFSFFSAINESVWEHIKITFYAVLFYNLYIYIRYMDMKGTIFFPLSAALIFITYYIPFVFYTYTSILGKNLLIIDILITLTACVFAQLTIIICSKRIINSQLEKLSLYTVIMLVIMFFLFTYYPPDFSIFI